MRRTVVVFTAALLALAAAGAAPLYANGAGMAKPQPAQPGAGPAVTVPPAVPEAAAAQQPAPPAACMMSAVAVDANAVYVLRGDQVMKLSKPNMQPMACATLPQVPSEAMTVATSAPGAVGAGPTMQQTECMVPSMAVADDAVYIVRGNEVLKLSKDLTQIQSTTVLSPVQPAQPAAAGQGPMIVEGIPLSVTAQGRQLYNQLQTMSPTQMEQTYIKTILDSHASAIAWSKLAQTKATRPELRQFAQQVINEEQQINQQWASWYNQWYGVTPTINPTPMGQQVLCRLQNLSGRDFDIAYLQAMEQHFSDAIALSEVAAGRAPHAQLKQAAQNMAQTHLDELQQVRTWLEDWYNVQPTVS